LKHSTYSIIIIDQFQTKPEIQQSSEAKELQEKVDHLTGQLLEVKEKLTLKEKKITQLNISLVKTEAELNKVILEQQPKTSEPSKELKEQLDLMTAQMMEMNDILAQKDKNIEKKGLSIAQKDAKLAQMDLKVSQAETKASQKETELVTFQKKLKNVEQKVDALEAQVSVLEYFYSQEFIRKFLGPSVQNGL
jgi:chromosome segregation ATPase